MRLLGAVGQVAAAALVGVSLAINNNGVWRSTFGVLHSYAATTTLADRTAVASCCNCGCLLSRNLQELLHHVLRLSVEVIAAMARCSSGTAPLRWPPRRSPKTLCLSECRCFHLAAVC